MTARQAFHTVLDIMVTADGRGPAVLIDHINLRGFSVISRRRDGETGLPFLNYRQLVKILRLMMRWMVAQNRFEELDFEIQRDEQTIAEGRLKYPGRAGEASTE